MLFLCGECLHATIKDNAQCVTCLPIKSKNTMNINCSSGFYDKYPEYNIRDEELDDGLNASIIYSSVYTYQANCATYGIISNWTGCMQSM